MIESLPDSFQHAMLQWFDRHGRHDLPWQQHKTHYRVWVSEIMLQQTQVSTVIPYYQRFMQRFATVQDLAQADQDEVMQYWAGLGYYARARNLHRCAQVVVDTFAGQFPSDQATMQSLPGIGRSTAAAILAIVDNQPLAILDGNVKRVLSRFGAIVGWPGDKKVADQLWQLAQTLTPTDRVADYTQAMMDLGATLCTRTKPQCLLCPLQQSCQAFQQGDVTRYPGKKLKRAYPTKQAWFALLRCDDQILLHKRPNHGIWGGLWVPPQFDSEQALHDWLSGFVVLSQQNLPMISHKFTHYQLDMNLLVCTVDQIRQGSWHAIDDLLALGLPAPVRQIFKTHYNCAMLTTNHES